MTVKQAVTAKKSIIKRTQRILQRTTVAQKKLAQPMTSQKRSPSLKSGEIEYYHIVVRPQRQFVTLKTQDIGKKGHALCVSGKRSTGTWATAEWLINKNSTYLKNSYLKAKDKKTQAILDNLGSVPRHKEGDIFVAKDKPSSSLLDKTKTTVITKKKTATTPKKTKKVINKKAKPAVLRQVK